MKKIILIILSFFIFSCEKPSDCIESSGDYITKEIAVTAFSKIKVYRGIEVIITQGDDYKVQILAGENFIDNVEVKQNGNQLIFKDETSCNWVREYGQIKIYVTTPTLEEIYSKTDRNISTNGTVTFPNLSVLSLDKDADGEAGAGTGDFHLTVDCQNFSIHNNNVSRFYVSGNTVNADFNFYFGDGRIEAQNLIAQNMHVYHRGSNDMLVKPMQSINGILNSTGNLVLYNLPPIVDVEELYQGSVVYP